MTDPTATTELEARVATLEAAVAELRRIVDEIAATLERTTFPGKPV
jgi:uncharacterized protein YceH (UPF0502 family)